MEYVRNEATSSVASKKMNDVRDGIPTGATPYQKSKKMFERANGFKTVNFDGNVSAVDSISQGRVRDMKKLFEQPQKEKVVASQSPRTSVVPTTALSALADSDDPTFIEERTDSDTFVRNKSDKFERQTNTYGVGPVDSMSNGLDQNWESKFDSKWDRNPVEFFEHESSRNTAEAKRDQKQDIVIGNEFRDQTPVAPKGNESRGSIPSLGTIDTSDSYIKKVKSLDAKILSLPSLVDSDIEEKEEEIQYYPLGETKEGIEQNCMTQQSSEGRGAEEEPGRIIKKPKRPTVKIQVTQTRTESQNRRKPDQQKDGTSRTSDVNHEIKEMITSAQLSDESMNSSSLKNRVLGDRPKFIEINHDDEMSKVETRENMRFSDEDLAGSTLTANDFNELTEKLQATKRKDTDNTHMYICPSESTDYSVDSKGNSKTTKSTTSKSAKSAKTPMKLKVKNNGMGKMLKKAKKGMGKSVKNLTTIVKNTMKSKPMMRQSQTSTVQTSEKTYQKDAIQLDSIFDEKLARGLVEESKNEVGIVKAGQYLDSGNRLLRRNAELRRVKDAKKTKEIIRKAHTYAYVGRQLAKQYLFVCRQEHSEATGHNPSSCTPSQVEDDPSLFEEFFLSFMQCVGLNRDDAIEQSRLQIGDALEILSSLSDEEANIVKSQSTEEVINKKILDDRKTKVRAAIAGGRDSADKNHVVSRAENAYRERSLAIHSFVQALRSFYVIDDTMKLSQIFLRFNDDERDDDSDCSRSYFSDSISYNYSESLKFDHGNSFHTRSFASEASMIEQEKLTSSRKSRKKEGSLATGIRPGTTVVAISVKNRNFKKKKQTPSIKWGRKQK